MSAMDFSLREDMLLADQREVVGYWASLKNGREIPSRADFHPSRILRRLPNVSLVDVGACGGQFRFRLAGTGLRDTFGLELTGRYLDQAPMGDQLDLWRTVYRRVAETGAPASGYTPLLWRDRPGLVQAWLRLPFSEDGKTVNMVLGYDRFLPIERDAARLNDEPRAAALAS